MSAKTQQSASTWGSSVFYPKKKTSNYCYPPVTRKLLFMSSDPLRSYQYRITHQKLRHITKKNAVHCFSKNSTIESQRGLNARYFGQRCGSGGYIARFTVSRAGFNSLVDQRLRRWIYRFYVLTLRNKQRCTHMLFGVMYSRKTLRCDRKKYDKINE